MSTAETRSWAAPVPLGKRLCWRWEDQNLSIPLTDLRSITTDGDIERGWNADLPTENGATVDLLYDPESSVQSPGESLLSLWLYVAHPDDGRLIDASIQRSDDAVYWIEYDPTCLAGECVGCEHGFHQWWEYVTDGPRQVLDRLRWLGSLPIRVPRSSVPSLTKQYDGQEVEQ